MKNNSKVKFKIYTLGCKVNQYDSAVLSSILIDHSLILSSKNLDLIIINSCSVTKMAITKARKLINSLKRSNPLAKIVVIGCWPKIYKPEAINNVDLVSSSKKYSEIIRDIKKSFPKFFIKKNKHIINANKSNCFKAVEDRSRYFIKIQDGCQQFCSYCVIPLARGPLNSRPSSQIIKEIKLAVKDGFEEIVLSGIHLGLYGKDIKSKKINLYQLLEKILKIKNLGRIRLSSIEITEINDEIIELILSSNKICHHLHIPLQSASDKVLKLMNRPYSKKDFFNKIIKIRKKIPKIAITTDVIVAFPGENEKDFQETFDFCNKVNFSKIHVFPFSLHEKAPAFFLPNRVRDIDIKNRSVRLRVLSSVLEKAFKDKTSKDVKSFKVLIESFNGENFRLKSEYYFDFIINKELFFNYINNGKKINPNSLIGKIIEYRI